MTRQTSPHPPPRDGQPATPALHRAYLGLGSNLQTPEQQVRRVVQALTACPGVAVVAVSSLYQSPAWDVTSAQPDYINAVVAVDTTLSPEALLAVTMRVERAHGRIRGHERNAARTIDIDLLLYDDLQSSSATLTLPHPRLHERAFVLRPLAEIAAHAQVPGRGSAGELLAQLPAATLDTVRPLAGDV